MTTREKKYRKKTVWKTFRSLDCILADKFRKLQTDKDVVESCIFPVVLCGAQSRSLTEEVTDRLPTCQRKMERRILHIVWNLRGANSELRLKTNTKDIVVAVQSLKRKWGGYLSIHPVL